MASNDDSPRGGWQPHPTLPGKAVFVNGAGKMILPSTQDAANVLGPAPGSSRSGNFSQSLDTHNAGHMVDRQWLANLDPAGSRAGLGMKFPSRTSPVRPVTMSPWGMAAPKQAPTGEEARPPVEPTSTTPAPPTARTAQTGRAPSPLLPDVDTPAQEAATPSTTPEKPAPRTEPPASTPSPSSTPQSSSRHYAPKPGDPVGYYSRDSTESDGLLHYFDGQKFTNVHFHLNMWERVFSGAPKPGVPGLGHNPDSERGKRGKFASYWDGEKWLPDDAGTDGVDFRIGGNTYPEWPDTHDKSGLGKPVRPEPPAPKTKKAPTPAPTPAATPASSPQESPDPPTSSGTAAPAEDTGAVVETTHRVTGSKGGKKTRKWVSVDDESSVQPPAQAGPPTPPASAPAQSATPPPTPPKQSTTPPATQNPVQAAHTAAPPAPRSDAFNGSAAQTGQSATPDAPPAGNTGRSRNRHTPPATALPQEAIDRMGKNMKQPDAAAMADNEARVRSGKYGVDPTHMGGFGYTDPRGRAGFTVGGRAHDWDGGIRTTYNSPKVWEMQYDMGSKKVTSAKLHDYTKKATPAAQSPDDAEAEKKRRRSEAAKKAAATRKANKAKKGK